MNVLRFHDVELDRASHRLRLRGETVQVEPQVYDVLVYLIEHRARVVPKEELLDEIWGSRFVSESALTSRIKSARAAVGDSGKAQHTIRTVHGTGYQFVAEIHEATPQSSGTPSATADPARVTRVVRPGNGFHGRSQELAELSELLAERQLVTIVGPGGTGKTRLAVEAVQGDVDHAVFLDLTTVRDSGAVAQALVASLGVEVGAGKDEVSAAGAYLRNTDTILVVDNCEHVADSAADMVRQLLDLVPDTTVLATSRVPLGLRDEHVFRLHPLPVLDAPTRATVADAAANPAVALFMERAQQGSQVLRLDEESAPGIATLCAALDGLPLALELAAGRASTFAVRDLLSRLDRRLDLLGDERADTPDRHRSLRATLDWSFEHLDPACQRLFVHLAVFPAGLTLEGIEWLAQRLDLDRDPLLVIDRLVAASLVNRVERRSGSRYVQLETMRTFGLDHLEAEGGLLAARDLQADWVLALLAELRSIVYDGQEREGEWDDRIRRELPNIRHCRRHLFDRSRYADLVRISMDLDDWAGLRDVSELWTWIDELLQTDGLTEEEEVRAHAMAGRGAWRRGRVDETIHHAALVLERAGDDVWSLGRGHSCDGVAKLFRGEFDACADAFLASYELNGNLFDGANASLGLVYDGQVDRARSTVAEVLRRANQAGWPSSVAWAEYVTGEVEAAAGEPSALEWLERAIERASSVGSSFTYGVAAVTRCSLMHKQGRIDEAAAGYRELITHWLRSGSWTQLWTTMRNAVPILVDDHPDLCLLLIDMADGDRLASRLRPDVRTEQDALRGRLVAELGPERVAGIELQATVLDRVDLAGRVREALEGR